MGRVGTIVAALALLIAPAASAQSWTVQTTPTPPHTSGAGLAGVSCGSDTSCVAVGAAVNAHFKSHAISEIWNGTSWTLQPVPSKPAWAQSSLSSVSCSSGGACTAVGTWTSHAGKTMTLAERWNGAKWTIQSTPNPSPQLPQHTLLGVSCPAANVCVAAGLFGKEVDNPFVVITYHALIERWNGHAWSVELQTPAPKGTDDGFSAVSCSSVSACLAVGSIATPKIEGAPTAWRWNGHKWLKLHAPNHGEHAGLESVSCTAPTACMAVGAYFISRDQENLAERWDGTHFHVLLPPRGPDDGAAELSGVWCVAANQCEAVGGAGGADPTGPLSEGWDGLHWTIQPNPLSDGAGTASVACRPSFCEAVGSQSVGLNGKPLAERYS